MHPITDVQKNYYLCDILEQRRDFIYMKINSSNLVRYPDKYHTIHIRSHTRNYNNLWISTRSL